MPRSLYNAGRVVGLNAYEIYVKQALAVDPNLDVATEREWLASTIASGSSMLLKIPKNAGGSNGYIDVPLPSSSRLVAANTIVASFLYRVEAEWDGSWAKKIMSYGDIAKPPTAATTANTAPIYSSTTKANRDLELKRMMQYIKIIDGVVYQKGQWKASGSNPPATIPDKLKYGQARVRIAFSDAINEEFYVLLTGFTDLAVVKGVSGLDTSVATGSAASGDFLGPAAFPWMAKIWFTTPANLTYQLKNGLSNGGKKNVIITNDPDSPITTIEVLNNIHTTKSGNYLKITQTLDGGDTNIEIDSSKLLSDGLEAGQGIIITDSTATNSQGTKKKQIKANIGGKLGESVVDDTTSTKQYVLSNLRGSGDAIKVQTTTSTLNSSGDPSSNATGIYLQNKYESYDKKRAYLVGDVVTHNNLIYKCTTAVPRNRDNDGGIIDHAAADQPGGSGNKWSLLSSLNSASDTQTIKDYAIVGGSIDAINVEYNHDKRYIKITNTKPAIDTSVGTVTLDTGVGGEMKFTPIDGGKPWGWRWYWEDADRKYDTAISGNCAHKIELNPQWDAITHKISYIDISVNTLGPRSLTEDLVYRYARLVHKNGYMVRLKGRGASDFRSCYYSSAYDPQAANYGLASYWNTLACSLYGIFEFTGITNRYRYIDSTGNIRSSATYPTNTDFEVFDLHAIGKFTDYATPYYNTKDNITYEKVAYSSGATNSERSNPAIMAKFTAESTPTSASRSIAPNFASYSFTWDLCDKNDKIHGYNLSAPRPIEFEDLNVIRDGVSEQNRHICYLGDTMAWLFDNAFRGDTANINVPSKPASNGGLVVGISYLSSSVIDTNRPWSIGTVLYDDWNRFADSAWNSNYYFDNNGPQGSARYLQPYYIYGITLPVNIRLTPRRTYHDSDGYLHYARTT